jgi:chemotaxis protein MotB
VKRQAPPRPVSLRASGDRWLFGYADIVTLLLACFASLYAVQDTSSAASDQTAKEVSLLSAEDASQRGSLADVLPPLASLAADLPGFDVRTTGRGLVLSFSEAGSFPLGQAVISPAARRVLLVVADAFRDRPNQIRVEGHTDDVPVRTAVFASNWELSTARATEVVRLLIEEGGIAPERLSAAGYGEHRPRVPNDSPEARARNRRVDLVVLDEAAAKIEAPLEGRR